MIAGPRARILAAAVALGAALLAGACEKKTHREARREFQSLTARRLPESERVELLEQFVRRYPEPKTNPYLVRACRLIAAFHDREKRPDLAASWYERALRVRPDDPDLLNALGYHYARHGMNLDRAVAVLQRAVLLAQERRYAARRQGLFKDSLGWAHRMRGELPRAVALLEEACRLAPDVRILKEHLADAYRALGERDRALEIYLRLYLDGRGTDTRLKEILTSLGREGGPATTRDVVRRIREGLEAIAEEDRRAAAAEGATLIHLSGPDGQPLLGSLFEPGGAPSVPAPGGSGRRVRTLRLRAARRTGAVLLLHALDADRRSASGAARALVRAGLVVLTLDLRGHGGSVSESLSSPLDFSLDLEANLRASEGDAGVALRFLRRHHRVDPDRVAAMGAGLGGLIAARALAGSGEGRAAALALLSPWGQAAAYRPHLARLGPDAVLLAAGSDEPAARTVSLLSEPPAAAVGSVLAPGDAHGFDLIDSDPDAAGRILGFLIDRLR
ncbi:MAG: serine aminopeptidase domain-containing protein [Acidobacteriota bacterium]